MVNNKVTLAAALATLGSCMPALAFIGCDDLFIPEPIYYYVALDQAQKHGKTHSLIEKQMIRKDEKDYLEIKVHGITKSQETIKKICKAENKISITTDFGAFSVEQDNDTIVLHAHCDDHTGKYRRSMRNGTELLSNALGKLKFSEVNDFQVTSEGNHAFITLHVPFEKYQPVTKKYSLTTGEPIEPATTAAEPVEK